MALRILTAAAAGILASASAAAAAGVRPPAPAVPTLAELASNWVDPTKEVSAKAALGAEQRDLATIQNFWGAVGISPEGTRPVDLFAVNSLEMPPFAGCGANAQYASTSAALALQPTVDDDSRITVIHSDSLVLHLKRNRVYGT